MVEPGDLVHVETNDCFHGKIRPETTQAGTYVNGSILDSLPTKFRNPVTGPIFVKGAQPGDILAISLLDIRPKGVGVACCGSWGGQLSCWMTKNSATLKFFDLSNGGSIVTMREEEENGDGSNMYCQPLRSGSMPPRIKQKRLGPISFEASPMLGVIGVAPEKDNDPIGTMPAGKHGGNLDDPCNGIGATIYIPIHHEGGLFSIGDMHASQGDGEIAGSGIEIGGDVLLKCAILKHKDLYNSDHGDKQQHNQNNETEELDELDVSLLQLEYPLTETPTHWITHGVTVCDIPQTTSIACQEAAKILIGQWGFTKEEAFCFLSVRGNLGLCQACHPDKGTQIAKMSVPKLENLCPRPFRAQLLESESHMDGLG